MLMNIKEHSLSTMKINHEILEQHCTGFPTMRGCKLGSPIQERDSRRDEREGSGFVRFRLNSVP